jgi:transcriptional regulator with XRE-family HTH domain
MWHSLDEEAGSLAISSSSVRQRELGKRLRELRLAHGLTVEDVAEKIMCSATKISRLETGTRRPSLRDIKDLCLLFEVDKSTADELMTIAREAREQEWWTQFEDLNLDPYLGLEEVASAITSYTMYYMPALLQIENYTRVIIETIAPKMDPKILQQRVEVRMRRQKRLEETDKPRYRVFLDEAVLYRSVGGSTVMIDQLDRVLEAERQNKVTFHVVPFDLGAHAAQDSNFILFEFDQKPSSYQPDEKSDSSLLYEKQVLSPVVFVEALTGNHYLGKDADIERYREAIEYLRDTALSPRDSVQRITEIKEVYRSGRHPASVGAASKGEKTKDGRSHNI